jgi:cation diffusion facilitator family transporter
MEKNNLKKGQRLTEIAAGLETVLASLKVVIGLISGSVVLISDAVHSVSDLFTILASWLGLKLAQKEPDEKFPYGYYKAENLTTVIISGLIFYAFGQMVVRGFSRLTSLSVIEVPYLAMGISLLDAVILFFFGQYEIKIGEEINSQSLMSLGKENRTHILTSSAVFLGTLATVNNIPYVEGIITLVISGLILKIGIEAVKEGVLGLMDVSPGEDLHQEVITAVEKIPGVEEAFDLKLRQSGPFVFGQVKAGIKKEVEVDRAHKIADQIEAKVKNNFRDIDSFFVHIEPYTDEYSHFVFPIDNDKGLQSKVAKEFGRADYYLFVNMEKDKIIGEYAIKNPYREKEVRAGLSAVKLINAQRANIVITKAIGEISFHTLRDYLIDVYLTSEKTVKEAIELFAEGELKKVTRPTKEKK